MCLASLFLNGRQSRSNPDPSRNNRSCSSNGVLRNFVDGANSPLDFWLRATQPGRRSVLGAGSIPRWSFTWHSRRAAELSIFLAHCVAAGKGTGVFGNYDPPQNKLAPKMVLVATQSEKQAVRCGLPVNRPEPQIVLRFSMSDSAIIRLESCCRQMKLAE